MVLDKQLSETLKQVVRDSMKRQLGQFFAKRFLIKAPQLIDSRKELLGYKLRPVKTKAQQIAEQLKTTQVSKARIRVVRQSLPNLQFQTVTDPDGDYTYQQKLQRIAVLKTRDSPSASVDIDQLQNSTPNNASLKVLSPFLQSVSVLSRSILPKKLSPDFRMENNKSRQPGDLGGVGHRRVNSNSVSLQQKVQLKDLLQDIQVGEVFLQPPMKFQISQRYNNVGGGF